MLTVTLDAQWLMSIDSQIVSFKNTDRGFGRISYLLSRPAMRQTRIALFVPCVVYYIIIRRDKKAQTSPPIPQSLIGGLL